MEIKKQGIDPETWRIDRICPNCKTKLSIGYKDIHMYATRRFFRPKLCFEVKCCTCEKCISLSEAKIPSIIRQSIWTEMDCLDRLINFIY